MYWVILESSGDRLTGTIPDLPSITLAGATLDSLAGGASRIIASHFVATDRRGEPRPAARSMAQLIDDRRVLALLCRSDGAIRVEVEGQ